MQSYISLKSLAMLLAAMSQFLHSAEATDPYSCPFDAQNSSQTKDFCVRQLSELVTKPQANWYGLIKATQVFDQQGKSTGFSCDQISVDNQPPACIACCDTDYQMPSSGKAYWLMEYGLGQSCSKKQK